MSKLLDYSSEEKLSFALNQGFAGGIKEGVEFCIEFLREKEAEKRSVGKFRQADRYATIIEALRDSARKKFWPVLS